MGTDKSAIIINIASSRGTQVIQLMGQREQIIWYKYKYNYQYSYQYFIGTDLETGLD